MATPYDPVPDANTTDPSHQTLLDQSAEQVLNPLAHSFSNALNIIRQEWWYDIQARADMVASKNAAQSKNNHPMELDICDFATFARARWLGKELRLFDVLSIIYDQQWEAVVHNGSEDDKGDLAAAIQMTRNLRLLDESAKAPWLLFLYLDMSVSPSQMGVIRDFNQWWLETKSRKHGFLERPALVTISRHGVSTESPARTNEGDIRKTMRILDAEAAQSRTGAPLPPLTTRAGEGLIPIRSESKIKRSMFKTERLAHKRGRGGKAKGVFKANPPRPVAAERPQTSPWTNSMIKLPVRLPKQQTIQKDSLPNETPKQVFPLMKLHEITRILVRETERLDDKAKSHDAEIATGFKIWFNAGKEFMEIMENHKDFQGNGT